MAPAGTGKTSLVAGWVAESSTPSAWLSLDDTDCDGVQFWSGVIAALDTLAPGCGDRALAMLRRPASRSGAVDQLVADLEIQERSAAVLVIDDFHLVDADGFVVESVSRFVRNLPSWLRVVLMSRREPKLPDRSDEVARPAGRAPFCRVAVLTRRGGHADDPAIPGTFVGAHQHGHATR